MAKTPTGVTPSATRGDGEVNGAVIRAFVDGLGRLSASYRTRAVDGLAVQGIQNPRRGAWYDLAAYRAVIDDLLDAVGSVTLRQAGRQFPAVVDLAPDDATVPEAIEALDGYHEGAHRGGAPGHYTLSVVGDGNATLDCRTPYPCALDRGIVEGIVDTYGRSTVVDVSEPTACRRDGADACRYDLTF